MNLVKRHVSEELKEGWKEGRQGEYSSSESHAKPFCYARLCCRRACSLELFFEPPSILEVVSAHCWLVSFLPCHPSIFIADPSKKSLWTHEGKKDKASKVTHCNDNSDDDGDDGGGGGGGGGGDDGDDNNATAAENNDGS